MHVFASTPKMAFLGTVVLLSLCLTKADAKPGHSRHRPPAVIPGGANQVQGLHGQVGDLLFDGHWRFRVLSVQTRRSYTLNVRSSEQDFGRYTEVANFDEDSHAFTPKDGYKFIAVKCHVKNGQSQTENLDDYSDDPKTAVTDSQENSYPPIAYDMVTSGAWITKDLLPGSGEDLTVLFAVPQNFQPKDLIFTLKNYSDHAGRNVRIILGQSATKDQQGG